MDLLATALVTEPTRRVLTERLAPVESVPRFFDAYSYAVLQSVCARLIPQEERETRVDVAAAIHKRLSEGVGKGWRYDRLPDDSHTFRLGLAGIDALAQSRFEDGFTSLDSDSQNSILNTIAQGEANHAIWATLPSELFFEELLAMAAEIYYAHPIAQAEIGYVGFADAEGWNHIGLDQYEPWEPRDR